MGKKRTKPPVLPTSVWDESRCEEYKLLEELLGNVGDINRSNKCLERIARCIEIADKLTTLDLSGMRPDFMSFLRDQIIVDRFGSDANESRRD